MIEQIEVATKVSQLMIECYAKLDASVAQVKDQCSSAEFEAYQRAVATIMSDIVLEVMNPLFRRHPQLKPKDVR
jgi:hypothetical protein